jgi:hypothetical protein
MKRVIGWTITGFLALLFLIACLIISPFALIFWIVDKVKESSISLFNYLGESVDGPIDKTIEFVGKLMMKNEAFRNWFKKETEKDGL